MLPKSSVSMGLSCGRRVAAIPRAMPLKTNCRVQIAATAPKRFLLRSPMGIICHAGKPLSVPPTEAPEYVLGHLKVNRVPSKENLEIWQAADAVCFDVDCTVVCNDGLDLLAEFMGVSDEVESLTTQAMDGTMNLTTSLEARLDLINCSPADIKRFLEAAPPSSRINPGIANLIKQLKARGIQVYFISGGFRELLLPIARELDVPFENIFANRMNWQWDDETGEPTKLIGFDTSEPTSRNSGKPEAIARIRQNNPYNTIIMVGDGITDLEAVQVSGGADLFIGYGGNEQRPAVAEQADWFVLHHDELSAQLKRRKVAVVGSGAMASAAVHAMTQNISSEQGQDLFAPEITMWAFDEKHDGKPLADIICETKSNPKYLPGIDLGPNVTATADLAAAVKGADTIVFAAPHQHMHTICKKLIGKVSEDTIAISLTKGMRVRPDGPQLVSAMINRYLGIDCSVLMGANVALDIANEEMGEAVIGYYNRDNAKVFQKLLARPYLHIELLADAPGAEICGTLRNIVGVAAGICDGLSSNPNAKATILKQGLQEIKKFAKALYPTVREETFLESCGVADLIATCYGGRNRRVSEAWTKAQEAGEPKSWEDLEKEFGLEQKLDGPMTCNEVADLIRSRGWEAQYPLFTTTFRIINGQLAPSFLMNFRTAATMKLNIEPEEVVVNGKKRKNPLPSVDL